MRSVALSLALALLVAAPVVADPHVQVSPYIEIDQVAAMNLNNDDAVTWTQVAAGVDASVKMQRAQGQVSARYERRVAETDGPGGADIITGLARASYHVARPLTIEAGALATRTRVDIRGAAPGFADTASDDNLTQLYSFYAGPTLATQAGPVLLGASYRFGYTKVEAPGLLTLQPGAPRQDYAGSSYGNQLQASASVPPGHIAAIGATVSAGWDREQASQLDQRYDSRYARLDLLAPLTRTIAVTAGVGYEKIKVTQRDPIVGQDGVPVTDRSGRFVTNPSSPRRIAYDTDGLIYDAGLVWRPSPRTRLTATVAHQYDSTSYTGAFSWRIDRGTAFNAVAYDAVETFGKQLRVGLQAMPTNFLTQSDTFGQSFNGCVFTAQPGVAGQGAGGCLNDVFQSIDTASYRARGVNAVLSAVHGRNRFGIGAGYASRHLFSPQLAGAVSYGPDDDNYYLQGVYSRTLDSRSVFDANVFANRYSSGLPGAFPVFGAGATGAYTRRFGRLGATAQLGVYMYDQHGVDDQWTAQALFGARYHF